MAGHHAEQGGFADAAAGENAEALAAAARDVGIDGLDAGLENVADALAFERVRRWQHGADGALGEDGAEVVERRAEGVDDAAFQTFTNGHLERCAEGDDFAAGVDAVDFAERHEEDVAAAEADDFGEGRAVVARGLDAADFADGGERAFGLDDEADELHDAAAVLEGACRADAVEGVAEAGAGGWGERGMGRI